MSGTRSKSGGRPTYFYYEKSEHFQKNCRHFRKDKGGADGAKPKKISESELHLVNDETTWVVDSGALYHLTPDRKCFSTYKAADYGFVKMGNEYACEIVA